jgi:hypothetical protein
LPGRDEATGRARKTGTWRADHRGHRVWQRRGARRCGDQRSKSRANAIGGARTRPYRRFVCSAQARGWPVDDGESPTGTRAEERWRLGPRASQPREPVAGRGQHRARRQCSSMAPTSVEGGRSTALRVTSRSSRSTRRRRLQLRSSGQRLVLERRPCDSSAELGWRPPLDGGRCSHEVTALGRGLPQARGYGRLRRARQRCEVAGLAEKVMTGPTTRSLPPYRVRPGAAVVSADQRRFPQPTSTDTPRGPN